MIYCGFYYFSMVNIINTCDHLIIRIYFYFISIFSSHGYLSHSMLPHKTTRTHMHAMIHFGISSSIFCSFISFSFSASKMICTNRESLGIARQKNCQLQSTSNQTNTHLFCIQTRPLTMMYSTTGL